MLSARSLLSCSTLMLLAGCGAITKDAKTSIDAQLAYAEEVLAQSRNIDKNAGSAITVSEGIWIGDSSYEFEHGVPFDARYDNVVLSSQRPLTLQEIVYLIRSRIGVPVTVFDDEEKAIAGNAEQDVQVTPSQPIIPTSLRQAIQAQQDPSPLVDETPRMEVLFNGKLSDLIDQVASRFGYDWVYEDSRIRLFRFQSRSYRIRALGGTQGLQTNLTSTSAPQQAQGGSGSGSGSQFMAGMSTTTSFTASLNFWEDLKRHLETLVGQDGTVSVSQSTSQIAVHAPRRVQRLVRDFVDDLNEDLTRDVVVKVEILKLNLDDAEAAGFSMNASVNPETGNPWVQTSNSLPSILSDAGGGSLSTTILKEGSDFFGTRLTIEALKQRGAISVYDKADIVAKNHIMASFQSVDINTYLASVETTITGDNRTSEALKPGTTTPGLTINMLVNINPNASMDLKMDFAASQDRGIDTVGSGERGSIIQTPKSSGVSTSSQASLKAGQTLMLTGFDRLANAIDKAQAALTGATSKASNRRNVLIVLVTPQLMASD